MLSPKQKHKHEDAVKEHHIAECSLYLHDSGWVQAAWVPPASTIPQCFPGGNATKTNLTRCPSTQSLLHLFFCVELFDNTQLVWTIVLLPTLTTLTFGDACTVHVWDCILTGGVTKWFFWRHCAHLPAHFIPNVR